VRAAPSGTHGLTHGAVVQTACAWLLGIFVRLRAVEIIGGHCQFGVRHWHPTLPSNLDISSGTNFIPALRPRGIVYEMSSTAALMRCFGQLEPDNHNVVVDLALVPDDGREVLALDASRTPTPAHGGLDVASHQSPPPIRQGFKNHVCTMDRYVIIVSLARVRSHV